MSEGAIKAAKECGQTPDVFYAFNLLEETGVCVIPGQNSRTDP